MKKFYWALTFDFEEQKHSVFKFFYINIYKYIINNYAIFTSGTFGRL